ncbi:XkdX family protein [Clostridium sp. YIM B02555]|nr:XkdX family protein [Clostridium sp. YIM B02555]
MYERLLYLYKEKMVTDIMLDVAVSKSWITAEQKIEILASVAA